MVSRRTMIAGGAGAAVLAGLGYRAWDRGVFAAGEGEAFEAWRNWRGRAGEGPTRPLHAAILAASAHNTQPWVFEPREDSITVYADLSRNLGAADPFRRELYQSIGCAYQNLGFAAAKKPRERIIIQRLVPAPAPKLVPALIIDFGNAPHDDYFREWARVIAKRHTNRGPYRPDQTVGTDFFAMWSTLTPFQGGRTAFVRDAAAKRDLGAVIEDATRRFIADPEMSNDSARWFRSDRREIAKHRDGVTTDTAGLSPIVTAAAKLLPDQSVESANKYWLDSTRDLQVPTAAAFGIIFVPDRLMSDQAISVGAHWQFLHLDATWRGLAAQPMNAPIEMMDRDHVLGKQNGYAKELRKLAGVTEGDPAFIFRVGYAERPAVASPRRRLQNVIRQQGFA